MTSIDTSYPYSPLRTWNDISGERSFSVPKSPLRTESPTAANRREERGALATDSVELSAYYPLAVPNQTYAQTPQPAILGGSGRPDGERTGAALDSAGEDEEGVAAGGTGEAEGGGEEEPKPGEATDAKGQPLDEEQQREVDQLQQRDSEVRAHEQAHKSVGGSYAGAVSYDYQQGPDGKRYAVGGEVSIDVSKESDPAATAAKMRQVRAAALAPAEPSGQDLSVAAEASKVEVEARQELQQQRMAEARGGQGEGGEGEGDEGENGAASAASGESSAAGGASSSRSSGASASPLSPESDLSPSRPSSPVARLSSPYGAANSRSAFAMPMYASIDVFA